MVTPFYRAVLTVPPSLAATRRARTAPADQPALGPARSAPVGPGQLRTGPAQPGPVASRLSAARPGATETDEPAPDQYPTSADRAQQPDSPAYRSLVPGDLADSLRRAYGVDVSDILVSRGPRASQQARDLGARAFTRSGEVVLPPEAGPIERPQTRALLAHELTHAAQQRVLGPSLPTPDSAAGIALEQQARAVEQLVLTPPGYQPPAPPAPVPGTQVQRQTEEIATSLPTGNAFDPFALLPQQPSAEPPAPPPPDAVPPSPEPPPSPVNAPPRTRLLDLDDSLAVGQLADSIYKRVRSRLQHELLIDRERAGLLSDFR